MKQTLLGFGKVAKVSKKNTVNVCVHEKLHTIRTCKRCYTITALRKRCKAITSVTTGQSLGTYGTKEQLLSRLMSNAQLCKAGNVSDGQFFYDPFLVWITTVVFVVTLIVLCLQTQKKMLHPTMCKTQMWRKHFGAHPWCPLHLYSNKRDGCVRADWSSSGSAAQTSKNITCATRTTVR